jgi:hypothetical protein
MTFVNHNRSFHLRGLPSDRPEQSPRRSAPTHPNTIKGPHLPALLRQRLAITDTSLARPRPVHAPLQITIPN